MALFLCPENVSSETIELKNGKTITGRIIRQNEEVVVVSKSGGQFVYSVLRDRIKKIRESTASELAEEKRLRKRSYKTKPAKKKEEVKEVKAGKEKKREEQDRHKKARLERYKKEVEMAKKARGRVKIKFINDRFGMVETILNGKVKAAMLTDTGASMVVISGEIARRLGIDVSKIEKKIVVVLADGSMRTATPVTLKSVKVGSSSVRNVEAAISENPPGPGIDGLLGMSFLKHFHVKLDKKENCLVLEKY